MIHTNKWHFIQHDSPYYDYEKELYSLPDKGNTSVDIRLTFDGDDHTCYYTILLRNDDGNTRDWEKSHYVPWDTGIAMLAADGVTFFKEELHDDPETETGEDLAQFYGPSAR
jgi:hypothetical protein